MPSIKDISSRDGVVAITCPLCKAPLDAERPAGCTKCDWVAEPVPHAITHPGSFRDRAAVVLSVVPGLGHMYKGYELTGAICTLGAMVAILACAVAATFTAGFGMLLLPIYWVGIMLHVYWLEDRSIARPSQKK